MNKKNIIITVLISFIIVGIYFLNEFYNTNISKARRAYQVYLNGESLGLIDNQEDLYNLINNEQQEIKEKYHVKNVYPPDGLDIVEINTYDTKNITSIDNIYNKVETRDDFTVKGYIVTIKPKEGDKVVINVLDKQIFVDALKKFIMAFVNEEDYEKYINDAFEDLTDIGSIIKNMYFDETITIKEGYISVKEEIFTDVDSLSQYLLFGADAKIIDYTVKVGDDIESISEKYDLNPQEFLIANPNFRDVDTMLRIGDVVNVTLLNPVVTFVYEVYKIEETIDAYTKKTVVDSTKDHNFKEITTVGVTGITKNHEKYLVTNGEQNNDLVILQSEVVRAPIAEVTTIGKRYVSSGVYVNTEGDWGWPTNSPYVITSKYGMRKGKLHSGVDISGTGYGSPIYSIADGVVVQTVKACKKPCMRWSNGTYVVVQHENNLYSGYLHLDSYTVKVGDHVRKGQQIGRMGETGQATGPHLHLGLYQGEPFAGKDSKTINPLKTIYSGK